MTVPGTETFAAACAADAELRLAVRYWTGGLRLGIGDEWTGFTVTDGKISDGVPEPGDGVITIVGPSDRWAPLMQATPPPFAQISVLVGMGDDGLQRSPRYDAGLALRFARVKRLRPDKSPADATTIDEIRAIATSTLGPLPPKV